MEARVVEISEPGRHLALHRGFLVVRSTGGTWLDETPAGETLEPIGGELGRIPLDQLAAILCTARGVTHSSNLAIELAARHVPLVYCGAGYLPAAIAWPVDSHHLQSLRIQAQVEASKPLTKRLWRYVVRAKIRHQALVLGMSSERGDHDVAAGLTAMAARVRSGDPNNIEAQAARRYWPAMMGETFRRDRDADGLNAMLNYGYAILRSGVARAVMAAGLHPSIGLHHQNRYNAMGLVDDLMEPYRPVVDLAVKRLAAGGHDQVSRPVKAYLAGLLMTTIPGDPSMDHMAEDGPTALHAVLIRLTQSLARVLVTAQAGQKPGVKPASLYLPAPLDPKTPLLGLPDIPAPDTPPHDNGAA